MGIGFFVRPWLTADTMLQLVGRYIQLMRELRMKDIYFFIYMKMEPNMFDEILNRVCPDFNRLIPTLALNFWRSCKIKYIINPCTIHITETSPYKSDPRFPPKI